MNLPHPVAPCWTSLGGLRAPPRSLGWERAPRGTSPTRRSFLQGCAGSLLPGTLSSSPDRAGALKTRGLCASKEAPERWACPAGTRQPATSADGKWRSAFGGSSETAQPWLGNAQRAPPPPAFRRRPPGRPSPKASRLLKQESHRLAGLLWIGPPGASATCRSGADAGALGAQPAALSSS